jgi:hypothetical protein
LGSCGGWQRGIWVQEGGGVRAGKRATTKAAGEGTRATHARATQVVTGKRRGEMAEAAFLAKAAELGFGIAKPWGDSDPFDFVLHSAGNCGGCQ